MDKNGKQNFDLDLHIGELVIHGFDHLDQAELKISVEQELGKLFSQHGSPFASSQSGHVNKLERLAFTAQPGSRAKHIGGQLAHSIYRSFRS